MTEAAGCKARTGSGAGSSPVPSPDRSVAFAALFDTAVKRSTIPLVWGLTLGGVSGVQCSERCRSVVELVRGSAARFRQTEEPVG